jgi:hypothetical protein
MRQDRRQGIKASEDTPSHNQAPWRVFVGSQFDYQSGTKHYIKQHFGEPKFSRNHLFLQAFADSECAPRCLSRPAHSATLSSLRQTDFCLFAQPSKLFARGKSLGQSWIPLHRSGVCNWGDAPRPILTFMVFPKNSVLERFWFGIHHDLAGSLPLTQGPASFM